MQHVAYKQGLVLCYLGSCGLTRIIETLDFCWISLFDALQSIPAGSEYNEIRLNKRFELNESLQNDNKVWWSHRLSEMQHDTAKGSSCKLFYLIEATARKIMGVGLTTCVADGLVNYDQQRNL